MVNIPQQERKTPRAKQNIDTSSSKTKDKSPFAPHALLIFGVLLIIYLLTFNGQFTSIDELNLYAMAESLVQTGDIAVPQVNFAAYHNPVGEHEIAFPLVAAPFYWLSIRNHLVNNIYVVMLLNPLLVAATSAFIYLSARKLDHTVTGSTAAAFSYGIASLGWHYALTFYREPLVGFLWTVGVYALLSWRHSRDRWRGGLGVLLILLSPLAKVNILFSIPFLFLIALKNEQTWKKRSYIILGVILVSMFVIFQLLYFWRNGSTWNYFYIFSSNNLIHVLPRLYGLLFSPIKGLVFYMPVFLLTIPGLYYLYRKQRFVALGIGLTCLSLLIVVSFYAAWYGGQSWGPRLLVPIIPILMIPIASLWDGVEQRRMHIVIIVVMLLSISLQLPVVTNNWWKGYAPFYALDPKPEQSVGLSFHHLALSPPWIMLKNWAANDLNLLWLQTDKSGIWHFDFILGFTLFACLVSLIVFWKFRIASKIGYLLWLPPLVAIIVWQVVGGRISVGYPGMTEQTGRDIAHAARYGESEPYTLVTLSNEFHIYFFEGFLKGDFVHHWYSPNQLDGFDEILENTKGEWLSFVVDRVHLEPGDTGKALEGWLNEQLFRFDAAWFDGYELMRYAVMPVENWSWQSVQYEFGPFLFDEFAVNKAELEPHDVLGVQIEVCSLAEIPEDHQIFVHLLGAGGTVEGLDGPLRYGSVEVEQWQPDMCFIEKRGIYIPPDTMAGVYDLIVGVYTPDGAVLPAAGADDSVTYRTLMQVSIVDDL
ncbi:MAG: hypothetical protein CSA11_02065 [Chloroflexi bacterium]|nr:MAG: hypothetical protein CSA11_02065 [Chloroflexota bacterium]